MTAADCQLIARLLHIGRGGLGRLQRRSKLGEPLDCVLVVPADGGFPCGRRHQVEVGHVDVRLVPVDDGTRSARCRSRSVFHARSASLREPRRPTASCPLRRTLHTRLATPPASSSMRATSSPTARVLSCHGRHLRNDPNIAAVRGTRLSCMCERSAAAFSAGSSGNPGLIGTYSQRTRPLTRFGG
jgi:hypothetical protein